MKDKNFCSANYYLNELGKIENMKITTFRYMELVKLSKKWEKDEYSRAWMPNFFDSLISEIIKKRLVSYKPVPFKDRVRQVFNKSKER